MQGFDVLTNNEYYYQRELTIPEDYAGCRILLRFDGVYSNTRVWVDGEFVRLHEGGFTSWDCDLTEFVSPGETVTLTVGVTSLHGSTEGIWYPDQIRGWMTPPMQCPMPDITCMAFCGT